MTKLSIHPDLKINKDKIFIGRKKKLKVVKINDFYRELKKYGRLEFGMVNKSTIHDIFEKIQFDVKPELLEQRQEDK